MAGITKNASSGFTIVETIVTLFVLSLFLALFFQAFIAMTSQRLSVAKQATANDIAYTNLRKIIARPTGLTCQTSGYKLLSSTDNTDDSTLTFRKETDTLLGPGRSQSVIAYPTGACADFATNPVKIVSTVTYNNGGTKVVHASYIP